MNKSIMLLLATLTLALSQPSFAQQAAGKVQTLRGTDAATTDQAPEERAYLGRKPGAQKNIARTFVGQPPLIPHAVENFDEVTLQENQCIECHGPENYRKKNAPRVGDAHFRDGKPGGELSAARHACQVCHVPQVDAKPLVQNTFRGVVEAKQKK